MDVTTRERQYAPGLAAPLESLGPQASEAWRRDPKHLLFNLARYKFVAQMLAGKDRVLEIGCGDAFASRIVAQRVKRLVATDFDPVIVVEARSRVAGFEVACCDPLRWPIFEEGFDAAYALDVLEHVAPADEDQFLKTLAGALTLNGVAVVGMPSLESQRYASEISRAGHVNLKSGPDLASCLSRYFKHVFSFSMNDEVVHTGFYGMAHYLLALCVDPR